MDPWPFWIIGKPRKQLKCLMIIGFKQKKMDRGVSAWGEIYPIFFGCLEFFVTLQDPLTGSEK